MMKDFEKFGLKETTMRFIELNEFFQPTAIQSAVLPLAIKNTNVIGISKTGSGKSHAFLIPLLDKIEVDSPHLQAVIIAPTRELATQLYQKAKLMTKVLPQLKVVEAGGGSDRLKQIKQLKNGCQVLIGTPGRIKDLVVSEEIALRVDRVRTFVLDEADMVFEYGFLQDVDVVAAKMPKRLHMMVFGATIPPQLQPFIKKYLAQATTINLTGKESANFIEYILVPCKHRSYQEQLLQILPGITPFICLIFANNRKEATATVAMLKENDYQVIALHGDLQARERRQALKKLQSHKYSYIVATDLAARGLDIAGISHVISLGLPQDLDYFTHRSGRTGRSGRPGTCLTLFQQSDEASIRKLKERGFSFSYQNYSKGKWRKLVARKIKKSPDEFDREIAKIINRKQEKVKPGYKKKRQEEVRKLQQQRKRKLINESIAQVRKAKYKDQQKNKKNSAE